MCVPTANSHYCCDGLPVREAAERNLNENREDLVGQYRRVCQETITTELLDVMVGFEAVSDDDLLLYRLMND